MDRPRMGRDVTTIVLYCINENQKRCVRELLEWDGEERYGLVTIPDSADRGIAWKGQRSRIPPNICCVRLVAAPPG
jgi:hypothetical protein